MDEYREPYEYDVEGDEDDEEMTDAQLFKKRMLEHAAQLIGMDYSKTYRWKMYRKNRTGSGDCSSVVAACCSAAGFPLLNKNGSELMTSTYEVNAVGFDLVYPSSYSEIGKNLPRTSAEKAARKKLVLSLYQEGDIAFDNFNVNSTRANKITHVRMIDKKAANIIHTANNREKMRRVPIDWGAEHCLAIIRVKPNLKLPTLPELVLGSKGKFVRMLQFKLNVLAPYPQLLCDADFGSKTKAALNAFKKASGLPQDGKCDAKVWSKLFPMPAQEEAPKTPPAPSAPLEPQKRYVEVVGGSVWVRTAPNTSGNRVAVAHDGDRYEYLGQATTGWYIINFEGKPLYISNLPNLTKIVGQKFVEVLGGSVYVRSIGSTAGTRLGTAHKGERYELIKVGSTGWYNINFRGRPAFISNKPDLTKIV